MRETGSTDDENRWQWLKQGKLKRETESFLCQLKNRLCELIQSNIQCIRQAILYYVDFVMERQSITHIVSACSILVKSQYRKPHDKVGTYVQWLLCKKHRLQYSNKWYEHTHTHTHTHIHTHKHTHTDTPQSVQRNDEYKILWDFNIRTDKVIECRLPDIVCINKQNRECQIIDFAIPGN